jgi:hypothetical protein
MDISIHKLFLYDHVRQLLAVDGEMCLCRDNGPMNKTPVKAHRGIDNEIIFRVLTPDRIPFDIQCGQEVYARIIDPDNDAVVLEKLCVLGPAKGLIKLILNAGDIVDIPAATYRMVLVRTEPFAEGYAGYNLQKPLYSDLNDNVAMEIIITDQATANPVPSIVYTPEMWTPDVLTPIIGAQRPCFYTGRIPGSRVLNHKDGVHTFSTYTQNFTGTLQIWGTLDETPDPYLNDARWFKIYPSNMSVDIDYVTYTGTRSWSFEANFMWMKFRYLPSTAVLDPGVFCKLIVRP